MEIFGLTIARTKSLAQLQSVDTSRGWWPLVRESTTGAWQRNEDISASTVLAFGALYACVTLIASDIAKVGLRLVQQDADGIWEPKTNVAYSPVLRKPNRFQNRIQFISWWVMSKLLHGNAYVLKQRDENGLVRALYVLDPTRVRPLVAPDGSVFYELKRDNLSGLTQPVDYAPAREIIHDTMIALFHPLVGVSPIYACGTAALQGLEIQGNSRKFFANGSKPGGVLTAPGQISQVTADRIKAYWDTEFSGDNMGKVAVLGDGLKYEGMAVSATDAQLIEQLKWTREDVCTAYHVPPYMIGVGPAPTYNNIQALNQQYYSQCLQILFEALELALDEGLGIAEKVKGVQYGTEFDLDDLLKMDTATLIASEKEAVGGGIKKPNESRRRLNLKPVVGGDTPYLQQQNYSLAALNRRDQAAPAPADTPAREREDGPERALPEVWTKASGTFLAKAAQMGLS